jgi:hypothetical protein
MRSRRSREIMIAVVNLAGLMLAAGHCGAASRLRLWTIARCVKQGRDRRL